MASAPAPLSPTAPGSDPSRTPRETARRRRGHWRLAVMPFRARASGVPISSNRLSLSVSTRETKNEATEATLLGSPPEAWYSSSPPRYASMTSPYLSSEKIRVMLTEIPSARRRRIAGIPSGVAGIFTSRLGRSICFTQSLASATLASVSPASVGATSTETNPSVPFVLSKTPTSSSQALFKSVAIRVLAISSVDTLADFRSRSRSS